MVHLQDHNPNRGRVKRTVLYHALNEGVVTAATLHKLTGLSIFSVRDSLERLRDSGFMQWASREVTPTTDRRFSGHGLTLKGIEAALQIDATEVVFATVETEYH